jgi:GGDEF domain-containing protein
LATIDSLTQLANRRGLYSIGDQVLRISARLKFHPMLVYFDLISTIGLNAAHETPKSAQSILKSLCRNLRTGMGERAGR